MGRVVELSSSALDRFLYGDNTHKLTNYLHAQLAALPKVFNSFSAGIVNTINSTITRINDRLFNYSIDSQLRDNNLVVIDTYIQELTSFLDIQNASSVMQRWVMAHPVVKSLYDKDNIEGYADTYTSVVGKGSGDNDYNYRRVMDGIVQDRGDRHVHIHYNDRLLDGDRELSFSEQSAILVTHRAIDWILSSSEMDFTSSSANPPKRNE